VQWLGGVSPSLVTLAAVEEVGLQKLPRTRANFPHTAPPHAPRASLQFFIPTTLNYRFAGMAGCLTGSMRLYKFWYACS
jgi:hypothetical protein